MFEQILDNVYIVSPTGKGNFPSTYTFYIDDEVKTIIDTPIDTRFVDFFVDRPLDMILNTHFHRDHSGSNHLFPDAKVYAHHLDTPAMQSVDVFSDFYGFNEPGNSHIKEAFLPWFNFVPSHITGHIKDEEIIDLGKTKLEVIHTPGHTPGHCAFFDREKSILFSGDIDLTGFGPWYGNLVSNVDDVIKSIEKLIDLKPQTILSAHKGVIDNNATEELKKYLAKVYSNENKIISALAKPLTLEELTEKKVIYGKWGEPTLMFYYFEKLSLERHLERLIGLGIVQKDGDVYYVAQEKSISI
ncbi:MAG TPA: MBL fold metallo-hydrolase [Syntrophomonadaceae bacterium]|nr:MBL fold metallo-hydrolase [Syntrophomonadaceae bacterium]